MPELRYPLFDGERVHEGATVRVENGIITAVRECDPLEKAPCAASSAPPMNGV